MGSLWVALGIGLGVLLQAPEEDEVVVWMVATGTDNVGEGTVETMLWIKTVREIGV